MAAPSVILDTLAQYGVTVDAETRQNEIAFWIDDKRISWRYDPSQPDIADLRLKLHSFGVSPKVSASTITTLSQPPEPPAEAPAAPRSSQSSSPPSPATNLTSYTVYRSAKVIAVELSEDLRIAKGHMLVIPLNRPNALLDMTREQFLVLFDATEENATEVETKRPSPPPSRSAPPAPPLQNDENDILAYLLQRKGGVKIRVIAEALGMTLKMTDTVLKRLLTRGTVELEDGFWHLTARPAVDTPAKKAPPAKKKKTARKVYAPRSPSGVPAQLGRMLAAMAYLSKSGTVNVSTQEIGPLLIDRDRSQFSARMPGAIDHGWALRGPPLPPPFKRGYFYQITPAGITMIKAAGNAPYEEDGEDTPPWLATV